MKENNLVKKIKEIMKDNKEGFTVFVDYRKKPYKLIIEDLKTSTFDKDIYRYCISITNNNNKNKIDKFLNQLSKKDFYNGFIGGWFNKENNQYYIDKVIVTSDRDYALQLAKEHNQISIYDMKKNRCIKVIL
jgi:hypothetical protein